MEVLQEAQFRAKIEIDGSVLYDKTNKIGLYDLKYIDLLSDGTYKT